MADTEMPDTSKAIVRFCPHCGNEAPQQLRFTHRCYEEEWTDDGERFGLPTVYFVASCQTCDGFLVYADCGDISEVIDFSKAGLVFPQTNLAGSVPKVVARIYEEAFRIKRVAPNAFATQIRRALEAIAEDRGAKAGTLVQRLRDLATRGEMPPTLAELSDTLRTLGNIGAHASEQEVQPWQVHSIDDFFRAVVEYIYVAPSKLVDFKKSLNAAASKKADEA